MNTTLQSSFYIFIILFLFAAFFGCITDEVKRYKANEGTQQIHYYANPFETNAGWIINEGDSVVLGTKCQTITIQVKKIDNDRVELFLKSKH